MFSKMLFAACATTATVLASKSNHFSFDITHDPYDVAIYVKLDIGRSFQQSFMTQIDTGSCNLVIPHECCETCNSDHKISSLSDPQLRQTSYYTNTKNYLGARFETVLVRDLFQGNGFNYFDFEVAVSQRGNQKWSGILGLCPQLSAMHHRQDLMIASFNQRHDDIDEINAFQKHYKKKLEKRREKFNEAHSDEDRFRASLNFQATGFMDKTGESMNLKNMFSIYLSQDQTKSKFTLGGIPEYYENLTIKYHKIKVMEIDSKNQKSNYWSIEFRDAKMGSSSLQAMETEVVLDTGCTMHQARKPFIDQMVKHSGDLTDCKRYGNGQGALICKCSSTTFGNLPALDLITNEDATIYLSRDHWAQYNAKFGMCAIMIQELPESWTQDLIVFGLPFFRQYFSIFDNEQMRVGLMEYNDMEKDV